MGALNLDEPELQIGAGCLIDQLVGQYFAEVAGLGPLGPADETRATLQSIVRYNHRESMAGHFNQMRSYVLGDEAATLMCSYPRGNRPTRPFPYFTEVMTGFEYTLAVHMLYAGMVDEGISLIQDIRDRYDGERRSPFNEAECGHHYARAMASWAAVLALTGFQYHATTGQLTIRLDDGAAPTFWSTGNAWGTAVLADGTVTVHILGGALRLTSVLVNDDALRALSAPGLLSGPQVITM
jgi:non-lysosomal glucosylceramidase